MQLISDDSKHLQFKDFIRKTTSLRNPITDLSYKGGNVLNTLIDKIYNDYNSYEFVTFNQARKHNLKMKKGSKGTAVYFYKMLEREKDNGKKETIPIVKKYVVFNLDCFNLTDDQKKKYLQDNKVDIETVKSSNERIEKLKKLPKLEISSVTRAFYFPSKDLIHMPSVENFRDLDHWHEVFFHELTHWTGSEKRLDRKLKGKTNSIEYSKEELIAELGSFFLCLDLGIKKDLDSGAAYLKSYLKRCGNKDLFEAMNKAIKAVQYIHEQIKE